MNNYDIPNRNYDTRAKPVVSLTERTNENSSDVRELLADLVPRQKHLFSFAEPEPWPRGGLNE
jgi:hypothetical protein